MSLITVQECPVCKGKGIVPEGFYQTLASKIDTPIREDTEVCKTCFGQGILWVKQQSGLILKVTLEKE